MEGLSLRQTVVRVDDSPALRQFVRVGARPMMDFTTLDKLKNALRPTTWEKINRALARQAQAEALMEEIAHFHALGARVLDQTRRRVLQGESVPNDEKLFSLFEPHTELLKRGKAGKDLEFGHMIQIQQVEAKFITAYAVYDRKPVERALLKPALAQHRKLFGADPAELSADKGYYESMEAVRKLEHRIDVVSIAKKGTRTPAESKREQEPLFRHAQAFRAGVEGTISFLKRVLRLARCLNKSWEHFVTTVGQTVFAHNLLVLARGS